MSKQAGGDADGWTTCHDDKTNREFYWNIRTNEVTWENPYASRGAAPGSVALPGADPGRLDRSVSPGRQRDRPFASYDASTSGTRAHAYGTVMSPSGGSSHVASGPTRTRQHMVPGLSGPSKAIHSVPGLVLTRSGKIQAAKPMQAPAPPPRIASAPPVVSAQMSSSVATAANRPFSRYFDEDTYHEEVNRRKLEDIHSDQKARKPSKKQVAIFRARKEEQKKRKFMAKFSNI